MSTERMSFDEACRELAVSEEELEQLVAAGEIATLKEGDTLYFKKDVVRKFKKQRESEPTILLSDDEINLLEDDAVDEIDLLSGSDEVATPAKPAAPAKSGARSGGAAREEISLDDVDAGLPDLDLGALDDETDELGKKKGEEITVRKGRDTEAGGDETLLNLDGILEEDSEATTPVSGDAGDNTLLDTDLLDLAGESDPFNADTAEETSLSDLTEQGTLLRGGGARVMQMKRKKGHPAMTVWLALAAVILVLPLGIMTNLIFASSPEGASQGVSPKDSASYAWISEYNVLEGVVEGIADMFKSNK